MVGVVAQKPGRPARASGAGLGSIWTRWASKTLGASSRRTASIVTATALCATTLGSLGVPGRQAFAGGLRGQATLPPEATSAFRFADPAWGSNISYNPYSPHAVAYAFQGLADLPLAAVPFNTPGGTGTRPYYANAKPFYPELASSWQVAGSTITLELRRTARWQNGKPFTSSDVMTSLLLAGASLNSVWSNFRSVSAPNSHEVAIRLQPWAVPYNVLVNLFQINIVPALQYQKFISAGLQGDILRYWKTYNLLHPTANSPAAAGSSTAGKALSRVSTALDEFNPGKLIGDGPFQLTSASESGILYKKWSGFWDARQITVPWASVSPMTEQVQAGALLSGRLDAEVDTALTDPVASSLNAHGDHYLDVHGPYQVVGLVFHLADYPFNLLPVRQALAYLIDRPQLVTLDVGGSFVQNPPQEAPDGISEAMTRIYLSKSQRDSLESYSYNPAKAARLLHQAGLSKKDGRWYLPNGKPFKFTIADWAGNQLSEDNLIISKMLNRFGIESNATDYAGAAYGGSQIAGDYAVSENWMDWGMGNPLEDFASTFVVASGSSTGTWNYPVSYNGGARYKYPVAIGVGPVANVQGLGRVNIGEALNLEVNTAKPSQWPSLTWDWVRWFNKTLPFLSLYNNENTGAYATSRYTDFPPRQDLWMWGIAPYLQDNIVVMMQHGYLRLKK